MIESPCFQNMKKMMMTNVEKRVAPIAQQLAVFLKNSGLPVDFFCHDITFPKGRCALLSSNITIPIEYRKADIPLVYTNERGRTLSDGVYITSDFENEKRPWFKDVKKHFRFSHVLSILKTEKDHQHFYSFTFSKCSQNQFTHHIINHIDEYHHFINQHRAVNNHLIETECEKFQFDFPYDKTANTLTKLEFINSKNNNLSAQQNIAVDLLLEGYSSKQIAAKMQLSPKTIEHYLATIRKKFHCKTTRELILKFR